MGEQEGGDEGRLEWRFRKRVGLLFLVSYLWFVPGCAKVGDPLPPVVRIPDPVRDLRLVQIGLDEINLVFTTPDEVAREVAVFRECGREISEETRPAFRVAVAELTPGTEEGTSIISDVIRDLKEACHYAIRLSGSRRHWSALSNQVFTDNVPVAQPPMNLRAVVLESRIELTWEPPSENVDGSAPANVVGYLVNSRHLSSEARFIDRDFTFGETETYSVQSVSRAATPMVLSRPSDPLIVEPEDTFRPEAPVGLLAVAVDGAVQLIWDQSPETDLAGYFVYRRVNGGSQERLSPLVTVNRYRDEGVSPDTLYGYAVSALDRAGNESMLSEAVTITVNP